MKTPKAFQRTANKLFFFFLTLFQSVFNEVWISLDEHHNTSFSGLGQVVRWASVGAHTAMSSADLLYDKSDTTKCRMLVGKSVFVLWKDKTGKETFYEGKVTEYDDVTDKHTVVYTDGDVKSYNMWRKTFRITGEGHLYTPTGAASVAKDTDGRPGATTGGASKGVTAAAAATASKAATSTGNNGTGGTTTTAAAAAAAGAARTGGSAAGGTYGGYSSYSAWDRKFPGYTPKKADAVTDALFSCYLDARCLEAGDRVVLLGSCEQLGGWAQGIVLDAHPNQQHVWQAVAHLPFEMGETCLTGIFEFKFGIRTAGGQIMTEGGQKRLVETMAHNYYANYRHTTARRYRPVQRASNASVATVFLCVFEPSNSVRVFHVVCL